MRHRFRPFRRRSPPAPRSVLACRVSPQSRNVALQTRTVLVTSSESGLAACHPLHKRVGHRFMPRIAQWHVRNSPAWRSVRYGVHYQIISLPPKSSPSFLREPWGQPGRAQGYFPLCGRDYCARMKRWAHLLAPARAGRETGRRQGRPSAIASFDHADRASPAFTSPIASRAARPSSGPGSFAAPQDRTHSIGDQYGRDPASLGS